MKAKNPLYVVKGSTVMEARSVLDLMLKKLNLEGAFEIFMNVVRLLLKQVTNYPTFITAKNMIDQLVTNFMQLVERFRPA